MGIPGVYKQIGPGERVALSKLAVQHLERTGHPFRIAIDISIWQFQIQSSQGGKNPALRTLYYRLLRLRSLSIQALFVFDGPSRPIFKRNIKLSPFAAPSNNTLCKKLLKCFGFPFHDAPGEAEAECAVLQKQGIVDAVLSEDVDTLMFGCSMHLRNWTSEGARSNKSPTHVNIYSSEAVKEGPSGLDSEGMILVALMSGGDYITQGIPKCGPKTACEAAKAGFGQKLCRLSMDDNVGLKEWRQNLEHELRTNESKLFRQKHAAIGIPHAFPDLTVLSYYKRPVVSSQDKLSNLRYGIDWDAKIDVVVLRSFVADVFNWTCMRGAQHYIRGLAPVLLVQQFIQRDKNRTQEDNLEILAVEEGKIVNAISGRRKNWVTDGEPELRISYIPATIVGFDLEKDRGDDRHGEFEDSDDEGSTCDFDSGSRGTAKRTCTYDPTQIQKHWVLETFVKLGVPLLVETWEEEMRCPKKFATRKAREKKALAEVATKQGVIDHYFRTGKPNRKPTRCSSISTTDHPKTVLLPSSLSPLIAEAPKSPQRKALSANTDKSGIKGNRAKVVDEKRSSRSRPKKTHGRDVPRDVFPTELNPWTLARRPSDTFVVKSPSRYSALGIYGPEDAEAIDSSLQEVEEEPCQSFVTPRTPARIKKHSRPISPLSPVHDEEINNKVHEGLLTPAEHDLLQGSPRKKRSPLHIANDLYSADQLMTPSSIRRGSQSDDAIFSTEEIQYDKTLSSKKVNRILTFDIAKGRHDSPRSDESSLPSPRGLLSPPTPRDGTETLKDTKYVTPRGALLKRNVARQLIAVRESLEGAWKHLDAEDAGAHSARRVYSNVEVVDLTAS